MSKTKGERLLYTIKNFPFDKLRLGTLKEKTAFISDFKDCHQETFVEVDGKLRTYKIDFPAMKTASITYYLEVGGKNMRTPKLYLNPEIHHQWSTLDSNGKVSRKKSPQGEEIEEFLEKFSAAIKAQVMTLDEDERVNIMGPKFEHVNNDTVVMAALSKHPKNDKTHPTRPNRPNEDKSKTIDMQLWIQNVNKRKDNSFGNNKKQYANVPSSLHLNNNTTGTTLGGGSDQHALKKLKIPQNSILNNKTSSTIVTSSTSTTDESGVIPIPDTDMLIYTHTYDLRKKTGKNNNNKRKGDVLTAPEPLKDYRDMIEFIYNSGGHPNASSSRVDMLVETTILGPTIHWKPNSDDGSPGTIRFTVCDLIVIDLSRKQYKKGLNEDRYNKIQNEREQMQKEFGFDHQSSDDDEEEDDENQEEKTLEFDSPHNYQQGQGGFIQDQQDWNNNSNNGSGVGMMYNHQYSNNDDDPYDYNAS